jgi:hypothetical protein
VKDAIARIAAQTRVDGIHMDGNNSFEQIGSRGFYRPVATVSFEQAVEMVAEIMRNARALGLEDLLVDTTGLTGFSPPTVFARYEMATQWVRSAGPSLRIAMVARPELVDRQKIGLLMAHNRGAYGEVFNTESDALRWLDSRVGPGQRTPGFLNRSRQQDE